MADIVLKQHDGSTNEYPGSLPIAIQKIDGSLQVYTPGESVSKTVDPDFSGGDMAVEIADGELVTGLTIAKPYTLVPGNIAKDVDVAGVIGTLEAGPGGGSSDGISIKNIAERTISGEFRDNAVETIGSYAFYGTGITSAAFPKCSVVNEAIFAYCSSLSYVELDFANISKVGSDAFRSTLIESISLPSCKNIYGYAFMGCTSLSALNAPLCITVDDEAFCGCSNLTKINLSTEFSVANSGVFSSCTNLSDVGECTLAKVYEYAFYGCSNLQSISMTIAFNIVGAYAFYSCVNLSVVTGAIFPNTTFDEYIGSHAFGYCSKLKSITIGATSGVLIGNGVFSNCIALSKVTLSSNTNVFSISSDWFFSTPIQYSSYLGKFGSIYVPSSLYYSFRGASGWSAYAARMVSYSV